MNAVESLMNANNLKPGPELDALVAEKVMGWTRKKIDGGIYVADQAGRSRFRKLPGGEMTDNAGEVPHPRFSTSISAAWEVVEKMNVAFRVEHLKTDGLWLAVFHVDGNPKAVSETAPHAICLAALKAVGVTE